MIITFFNYGTSDLAAEIVKCLTANPKFIFMDIIQ